MPFEGTADVDLWLYIADFSTRSGETVFGLPETEGPELPLKWSFFPAETASRLCAPQNRGYSSNHGKSRLAWDCVVEAAVCCEPVSPGRTMENPSRISKIDHK